MSTTLRILLLVLFLLGGCDRNPHQNRPDVETKPEGTATPEQSRVQPQADNGRADSSGRVNRGGAAHFIGTGQCSGCHQEQFKAWQGSDHDLAMQTANDKTVLGDFNDAQFNYFGTVSRFHKKDGQYFAYTDGPDGELHDYPIAYTFGVFPLQQYLVKFPGGKLQALSIAWDSRSKADGGQRWYHLNPDEHIEHGDELHWTGLNYNWNFMCADCHSTNLRKNYDPASQTYSTTWSELNVACEACHGPGSRHREWAQNPNPDDADKGLTVSFSGRNQAAWAMDSKTGIAHLQHPADTQKELETCAQCHSRRATSFPAAQAGDKLLNHFNPALLSEPLYHADGQINDEVYVYGSFLQSRMYAAGVTCSNCHNPHSLKVRAEGNAVCAQCHMPQKFDTPEHHFHPVNSTGAQCVNCHMPTKTYMQVDARRDHSLRIPRPDLSDKLETPNACTGCHADKSNAWAAAVLEKKFGKPSRHHYGEALYAGRHGLPGAEHDLVQLIADESQPEIARATAVSLLPRYLSQSSAQLLQAIAQGDNALLQLGLAHSLQSLPRQIRPAVAIPLLYEDERVTSALAANALVGLPMENYPETVQQKFAHALNDYINSEEFTSDRPESLVNLAGIRAHQGQTEQAVKLFERAITLAPYYTPAYINLADLYRAAGREGDTESLLRGGLNKVTTTAPLQYSLGLSLVRQQRKAEATEYLRAAAEAPQTTGHYVYVYAIALHSVGKSDEALKALEQGLTRFPHDVEILQALVSLNREAGNLDAAAKYEQMLR